MFFQAGDGQNLSPVFFVFARGCAKMGFLFFANGVN